MDNCKCNPQKGLDMKFFCRDCKLEITKEQSSKFMEFCKMVYADQLRLK